MSIWICGWCGKINIGHPGFCDECEKKWDKTYKEVCSSFAVGKKRTGKKLLNKLLTATFGIERM